MKKEKIVEEQYVLTPLNNLMMNYGVYVFSKSEKFLVNLITFILGGATGLIFYSGLFKVDGYATLATYISDIIFFVIVGYVGMKFLAPMYKQSRLEKRKNAIKTQFRDMLESLAASFSAGSNVHTAFLSALNDLKMQYDEKDMIIQEMQQIINASAQGVNIDVMLRDFSVRSQNDDILNFADVFGMCHEKGGNMQAVILRTHDLIGQKITISDEIQTKLTSNKMQHNVMSVMPLAVVLMLKLTNESFAQNFATPLGVIVNTIAIGIFIGAYKYGQKIVDIKA